MNSSPYGRGHDDIPAQALIYTGGPLADPALSTLHYDADTWEPWAGIESAQAGIRYRWINGFTGELTEDPPGAFTRLEVIPPVVDFNGTAHLLRFALLQPEQWRGSWLWHVLRPAVLDDYWARIGSYVDARDRRIKERIQALEATGAHLRPCTPWATLLQEIHAQEEARWAPLIRSLHLHKKRWLLEGEPDHLS